MNNLEIEVADYHHTVTNKSVAFLAKFPVGKVPAFEGADGLCLSESDAIAQYVAASGPFANQLLGETAAQSAQIQQWILFADGEVYRSVLELVMWRVGMCSFSQATETAALEQLGRALRVMEAHLQTRAWLVDERMTLADLTAASSLLWAFLQIIDEPMRQEYPETTAWYLRVITEKKLKEVYGAPKLIDARRAKP